MVGNSDVTSVSMMRQATEMFFTIAFVNTESEDIQSVDLDVCEARTNDLSSEVDVGVRSLLAKGEQFHNSCASTSCSSTTQRFPLTTFPSFRGESGS